MSEAQVLESIKRSISEHFEIDRMILFGSRARGDHQADSDWDVLVITKTDVPFIERQAMALKSLDRSRDYSVDLLLYTPEEFQEGKSIPGSALYWAEVEGRLVHGK